MIKVIIDKTTKFFLVTDPTPRSEVGDHLSEETLVSFALMIRGGLDPEISGATIHLDREAAEMDVQERRSKVGFTTFPNCPIPFKHGEEAAKARLKHEEQS